MRMSLGPLVVVLALSGPTCGGSPTAPSPIPAPTPTPAPTATVTGIRVTGNTVLRSVGETSQLTVTGTYSDGTTRDITTEVQWMSSKPSVIGISPAGVVTALTFGVSNVNVHLVTPTLQIGTGVYVFATPPNTFVFWGRAREPGNRGIPAVRVLETMTSQSRLTDAGGDFEFPGLAAARFRFEKDSFEPVEVTPSVPTSGTTAGAGTSVDAAMQRIVRLTAGESANGLQLAPRDLTYTVGPDRCFPCKLIRVMAPTTGTLRLNATWTGSPNSLHIWVNGNRYAPTASSVSAETSVRAGEVLVYVGWTDPPRKGPFDDQGTYVTFDLASSLGAS